MTRPELQAELLKRIKAQPGVTLAKLLNSFTAEERAGVLRDSSFRRVVDRELQKIRLGGLARFLTNGQAGRGWYPCS